MARSGINPLLPADLINGKVKYHRQPDYWPNSSLAARTATAVSPAARLSSTPTAAGAGMAVARSAAKTPLRLIAAPPTWPGLCAAKNIVAAGLADRCEVQLAYAIRRFRAQWSA